LDAAIAELSGERARIAPKAAVGPAVPPRTLDRADGGPRFVELSADAMTRALALYDQTDHQISLDDCAVRVSGGVSSSPPPIEAPVGGDRAQLHACIVAYQQEHRVGYAEALGALTGTSKAVTSQGEHDLRAMASVADRFSRG